MKGPAAIVTTRADFLAFCEMMMQAQKDILRGKGEDYASDADTFANFRQFGTYGVAVRMSDKLARIINFEKRGNLKVKDETVEDTALDLANYCLIYLAMRNNLLYEKEKHELPPKVRKRAASGNSRNRRARG